MLAQSSAAGGTRGFDLAVAVRIDPAAEVPAGAREATLELGPALLDVDGVGLEGPKRSSSPLSMGARRRLMNCEEGVSMLLWLLTACSAHLLGLRDWLCALSLKASRRSHGSQKRGNLRCRLVDVHAWRSRSLGRRRRTLSLRLRDWSLRLHLRYLIEEALCVCVNDRACDGRGTDRRHADDHAERTRGST